MKKWEGTASLDTERYSTLGFVTLTFDLWVKFCEFWRKILWLRIVWWPLRVNRTVNEEMRGYRPSKMTLLAVFWLRDLDLWPLGQISRMVTQDVVIAHLLVAFAIKSDIKWRNERVPRYSTLQTNTNTTLTWRASGWGCRNYERGRRPSEFYWE